MFVGAFQNKLKTIHFIKSLAQNLSLSLAEAVAKAECYIKGEERNAENKADDGENKARDANECVTGAKSSHPSKKN